MADPICKVGDRTDFVFSGQSLVGEVTAVIEGPIKYGLQMEHQYTMLSNGDRYRVFESNVSTPCGPWDD